MELLLLWEIKLIIYLKHFKSVITMNFFFAKLKTYQFTLFHRIYPVLKSGFGQKKKLSWMTRKRKKKTMMKQRKKKRRSWRFVDNWSYESKDGMRVSMRCWSAGTHLNRSNMSVKCLAQEHNTMFPARVQIQTARFGGTCTVPPQIF